MRCSDKTFNEMSEDEQCAFMEAIEKECRQLREKRWAERRKLDAEIMELRRIAAVSSFGGTNEAS